MHAESANGDDPFAKVKGLISEMISRLEDKASPDATHKAYCDEELSESRAKKEAKLAELEKLSASIDTKTAKSAQLKREVLELQTSLGELAASQVAMTKLRAEEKDAFATNKRDLEDGIEGVRSALGVLRDYYGGADTAHATAGESGGIIGLREVIESDFSKNLAGNHSNRGECRCHIRPRVEGEWDWEGEEGEGRGVQNQGGWRSWPCIDGVEFR